MSKSKDINNDSTGNHTTYFQNGKIYLIELGHSDIGWLGSPNTDSDKINNNINTALNMMLTDSNFHFTVEDIHELEAFLAMYPEKRDELDARFQEGRMGWGGTYAQPLFQNIPSELVARQLSIGMGWFKNQFPDRSINYATAPDNPAFLAQMPQLLKKSGITNYFISRYHDGLYQWVAPDGSDVFVFSKRMYGSSHYGGDNLSVSYVETMLNEWESYYSTRNIAPYMWITSGDDYTPPSDKSTDISNWNSYRQGKSLPIMEYATFELFMNHVKIGTPNFDQRTGERVDLWMYEIWPTHYEQISNQRKGTALARAAEVFSVFRAVKSGNWNYYPNSLYNVWKDLSLACHTFQRTETEATFATKYQNACDEACLRLNDSLTWLARKVDQDAGKIAIVVYNDQSWVRDDVVICNVPAGVPYPYHMEDQYGKDSNFQTDPDGNLVFVATNVPSLGYRTYYIVSDSKTFSTSSPAIGTEWTGMYENSFYKVTPSTGGLSSIYDKLVSTELFNTEKFKIGEVIEQGFTGTGASEEITLPQPDKAINDRLGNKTVATWICVESGPVRVVFETNAVALGHSTSVKLSLKLYTEIRKIDLDVTDTYDGTLNYQHRIMFPINTTSNNVSYEIPFGVSTVGQSEFEVNQGWGIGAQHPREVQNWMYAQGTNMGITIGTSTGVIDYIDCTSIPVNYPILQPILLTATLSCLKYQWTMAGTHHYHFSILSHNTGYANGRKYGVESQNPLIAVAPGAKDFDADLPESKSFCSVSPGNVVISAVKKAENDGKIAVRLYETEGMDSSKTVTFMNNLVGVEKTNLIENDPISISFNNNTFAHSISHWGIETYKIDAGLGILSVESKLTGTLFGTTPFGDATVAGAFDGNTSTWFSNSVQDGGYVGIDLGMDNEKRVTKIRWFNKDYPDRMKGGKFQGSNAGQDSDFTDLYIVPSTFNPMKGWNEINLSGNNTKYRYLRYRADSWCTIYELEFYGDDAGSK